MRLHFMLWARLVLRRGAMGAPERRARDAEARAGDLDVKPLSDQFRCSFIIRNPDPVREAREVSSDDSSEGHSVSDAHAFGRLADSG